MVKNGVRKLKNRRGETLIESLVAILAFTLSSIAMYSMVTAAAEINYSARQADKDFQAQVTYIEKASGGTGGTKRDIKVSVTLTECPNGTGEVSMGTMDATVYQSDSLTAVYPKGGG